MIVGIDPDSEAHGVAIYHDGALEELHELALPNLVTLLKNYHGLYGIQLVSIENVLANNFIYAANNKTNKALQAKVGLSVGRCQQSQQELMRWLDHIQLRYILHKPQKGNWAENKKQFERVTGWKKRSNKDTRSAAFFGYLALSKAV